MTTAKERLTAALTYVRTHGWKVAAEASVNFIGPFVIYSLASDRYGEAPALMLSSIPPILWSIVEFIRARKVDAISIVVLSGIALSLLAFLGGGGVRALQLRERMITGLIGLVFLGSAAIGRPVMYYLARASLMRSSPEKAAMLAKFRDAPAFRRAMLTLTLAWGAGLVGECALAVALTFALSVKTYLIVGPIVGYGVMGLLMVWTIWFARRRIGPGMRGETTSG